MACTFQATIGGMFAPLIGLSDEDMDMDTMITTYNTAVTDAASEILGIGAQCEEIETCLNKNNSKRVYQLVKDLTSEKQGRSSTIQDKSRKCLTEEKEILSRWTEYCTELYNYESCGDNTVLDCSQPP